MPRQRDLTLAEELTLLALRDQKGTVQSEHTFEYTLAAALVAELLLRKRITIEENKKKLVSLVSSETLGNPVLDDCLARLQSAKKRGSLQTWVTRFAGLKNLKHRVALQLCRRGILRAEDDKVLLVFTRKTYPTIDPKPEQALVEALQQAIFTDSTSVAPRTAVLISLAHHPGLLKNVFDKKVLRSRKARIEQIVNGELTGKAAKEAVQAAEAAAMLVVMMGAMVASSGSH